MFLLQDNLRCLASLLAGLLILPLSGCALLNAPPASGSQGTALAWLAQWVSQPLDVAPGFDLEVLRPEPHPPVVTPQDLLEVTVWDLDEPGKPYTFPVRVSDRESIEAPLVGEVSTADQTPTQIEAELIERYQTGEYLVHPRVLVRSLDPPTVKVQVSGAVQRPGYVELSRNDTSVYAALVSAGGLKKTAGKQVGVLRRSRPIASSLTASVRSPSEGLFDVPSVPTTNLPAAQHRANSLETMSVAVGHLSTQHSADERQTLATHPAASSTERHSAPTSSAGPALPIWHDVTHPEGRDALRRLSLADGDEVIVKSATPPVRLGGIVERPGPYFLPAGRSLNVWQTLDMAGGVRLRDVPLHITLIRPAAEGRAARRWVLSVDNYDHHPTDSPLVEPGDVLHVEPTAGTRLKRAVGDLWNKP